MRPTFLHYVTGSQKRHPVDLILAQSLFQGVNHIPCLVYVASDCSVCCRGPLCATCAYVLLSGLCSRQWHAPLMWLCEILSWSLLLVSGQLLPSHAGRTAQPHGPLLGLQPLDDCFCSYQTSYCMCVMAAENERCGASCWCAAHVLLVCSLSDMGIRVMWWRAEFRTDFLALMAAVCSMKLSET